MEIHPVNEFVVKVASRCNINCDYCYEYNLGDESWRNQPKLISADTTAVLGKRIAEHAKVHALPSVAIALHGGEPLMLGAKRLDEFCQTLRREIGDLCEPRFTMQTNAILLDSGIIEIIKRHGIDVAVSVDGTAVMHDRHRMDHQGRGTYEATIKGVRLLQERAPESLCGLLAVIDVRNDPLATFDAIAAIGIEWFDFLLPHYHWDRPPLRPDGDPVAYGRWYWTIYQAWVADRHPATNIRFLINIVSQLAGGKSIFEVMTLAPCQLITVATDGSIEGVDCLKSTASGQQRIGLSIHGASFDMALRTMAVNARQSGELQLAETCRQCEFKRACAGGYFPHRFGNQRGFDNPSVYCSDLYWLLTRIRDDLHSRKLPK